MTEPVVSSESVSLVRVLVPWLVAVTTGFFTLAGVVVGKLWERRTRMDVAKMEGERLRKLQDQIEAHESRLARQEAANQTRLAEQEAEHRSRLAVQEEEHRTRLAELERYHQLSMAALNRRLNAHQTAYTLWKDLARSLRYSPDLETVQSKCREFFDRNCLYLGKETREEFQWCFEWVKQIREPGVLDQQKMWQRFENVPLIIAAEVGLPEIAKSKIETPKGIGLAQSLEQPKEATDDNGH